MDYSGTMELLDGTISGSLSNSDSLSGDMEALDGAISGSLSDPESLSGSMSLPKEIPVIADVDYETQVLNKPSINSYTIEGHKTGDDYKLQNKMKRITEHQIDILFYGG